MIDTSRSTESRSAPLLSLATTLGPVRLAVTDRDRALAVWRDVVGLEIIEETGHLLRLGAGGVVLIELETGALAPVTQNSIGLYHVALHVPARGDLAAMAARALARRQRIAPTDHLVSEAIYLWDADGNGIEITFETPWRGRLGNADEGAYAIATDGKPHSGREPIDLDGLLDELADPHAVPAAMPAGTRIGHVHLHVTDLDRAMDYWRDVVGFGGFLLIRSFGMGDVGLDYMPHTIAFNIWSGPRATLPPANTAGLRFLTLVLASEHDYADLLARLEKAGMGLSETAGENETTDPFGNRVRLVKGWLSAREPA